MRSGQNALAGAVADESSLESIAIQKRTRIDDEP
jgi:hypothetical protein